jgi:FKBP-type peptidyl-prolyl cis-trans isomerase
MGVAELLLKRKQELTAKNVNEGEVFRTNFELEINVVKLESGVLYRIIEHGSYISPL